MTDKMGAKDFSDAMFETLKGGPGLTLSRRPYDVFPWHGEHTWDQLSVQSIIQSQIYTRLRLAAPRFVWAPSPASMYTAINMLRTIQSGQKHKFVESLVLADDPIAAAKKTVLDAIIDPKITATTGQLLKPLLNWKSCFCLWVLDMEKHLRPHRLEAQGGCRDMHAPSVNEITIYPVNFRELLAIQNQTLSLVPYVHICWICRPPVECRAYDDGHLEYMRFADGYEVHLDPVPAHEDGDTEVLELPEGEG